MQITAKTKAWVPDHRPVGADALKNPTGDLVHVLAFANSQMQQCGWTLVGEAEITVTIDGMDGIVKNRIDTLRAQMRKAQADAEMQVNYFKSEISKLEAITYEPEHA